MPRRTAADTVEILGVPLHILFVCTGNICRSPIAERLAILYASQMSIDNFYASSAGTNAVVGRPIHPLSAAVVARFGGETSNFAARQLNGRIAREADLILAMTVSQRDTVLSLVPQQLNRTFTISEAAALSTMFEPEVIADLAHLRSQLGQYGAPDIPDPIRQTGPFHKKVGEQIAQMLPPILSVCKRSSLSL